MQTGPIEPIARSQAVSQADRLVATAWRQTAAGAVVRQPQGGATWSAQLAIPLAQTEGATPRLLFWTDAAPLDEAVAIADGEAAAPVYILASESADIQALARRLPAKAKVLLRKVPNLPCAGTVLAGIAHLWIGAAAQPCRWRVALDADQSAALRDIFLRLFWHEATAQMWLDVGRWSPPTVPGDRPFDVPYASRGATALLAYHLGQAPHLQGRVGGFVHAAQPMAGLAAGQRLWTTPAGNHHTALAAAVAAGAAVVGGELGLPDCWTDGEAGRALVQGLGAHLSLTLNRGQAAELAGLLAGAAPWQFVAAMPLGRAAAEQAQLWLPGEDQPRACGPEQKLQVDDVPCTQLRDMPSAAPRHLPVPDQLALSVNYTWRTLPPRLPSGSADDALVGQWQGLDRAFASAVAAMGTKLGEVAAANKGLGQKFSTWLGATLGFAVGSDKIANALEDLRLQVPSRVPAEAHALLAKIEDLRSRADELASDVTKAAAQAQQEQDRQNQQAAWQRQRGLDEQKLAAIRQKWAAAVQRLAELQGDAAAVAAELADADGRAKGDLKVKQKRIAADLAQAVKGAAQLADAVAALEHAVAKPFVYAPSIQQAQAIDKRSGRFVPESSPPAHWPAIPAEAPPAVGRLRMHNGKRYLVITDWGDLDTAEEAAARLRAVVVAGGAA